MNVRTPQHFESQEILLSILLPAYNYAEGIEKIFNQLDLLTIPSLWHRIEIVVMDDSTNNDIEIRMKGIVDTIKCVRYVRNNIAAGPCKNWNMLIEKAQGKYYILMHHDEFPLTKDFISEVLQHIEKNNDVDMIMMDCILMNKSTSNLRRHIPSFIRRTVYKLFPEYLFRRNVVGPTATLIIKKSLYSNFDCKLTWLIDVDYYYQLRKKIKNWVFYEHLKIVSYTDYNESITESLSGNIAEIRQGEYRYLARKHAAASLWLNNKIFYLALEGLLWVAFRVMTRSYWYIMNKFKRYPVTNEMARIAFDDHE
jgi:glycosyltransferase involved in cell wall biosynthesis